MFEDEQDFIPFLLSDTSDDDAPRDRSRKINSPTRGMYKGERKTRDDVSFNEPPTEKYREQSPSSRKERERGRGNGKERERSQERGRRDLDREGDEDRARDGDRSRGEDRHPERHGTKRKYEMLFDPRDGYSNKKQRSDAASRKAPWVAGLNWHRCKNVAEMLHDEVEAFVNWISPSPVEDEVRGMIVTLVSDAVTSAFPDAKVLPFGSFGTKLYLPLGDIDLVILSDSMAYSDKANVLHALANTLKRAGITSRVTIIAKAKVPIVKCVTTHGRFNVDISINQSNGILSGDIINGFLHNMHPSNRAGGRGSLVLRSLVMITKAFLSQRSLNEVYTGGLGSYSIVCLAISFLQMHPKIRRGEIDAEKNLGVLVMEFFELYGCYFNYEETGISVRDGGTYFSKKQRGWYDYYKSNLLSIEDPADPSNDISRGSYGFQKVRTTFAGAYGILTSSAYLHAGILSARREGRTAHLRSRSEPEEMSILSSVMGITQETMNHRKLVQELYDKRVLHNLLGLKPSPTVVKHYDGGTNSIGSRRPSSPGLSQEAMSAGRSARHKAEVGVESDEEYLPTRHRQVAEDQDEGRYDIGRRRQAPRKYRKIEKAQDSHTAAFTTDDDEYERISVRHGSVDSLDEEVHYDDESPSRRRSERRRSFWLSKAMMSSLDDNI